jgi:DNA mismatch endonuclease (patch repair protein)
MRGNRRRDTSPELRLRSALHRSGRRFRVDFPADVGNGRRPRPDIAFIRARLAVFVDGCFWHGCPEHGNAPKTNRSYWGPKLRRKVERALEDTRRLEEAGWCVLRLWEHVPLEDAVSSVEAALAGSELLDRARTGPSGAAAAATRRG